MYKQIQFYHLASKLIQKNIESENRIQKRKNKKNKKKLTRKKGYLKTS